MKNWLIAFFPFGIPLLITAKMVQKNPVTAVLFLCFCFLTVPAMAHGAQGSIETPLWVYALPICLGVAAVIIGGVTLAWYYREYKTSIADAILAKHGQAHAEWKLARLKKALKLDLSLLIQLNQFDYNKTTFDSRYSAMFILTPFGAFMGWKSEELYESLKLFGYYQEALMVPIHDGGISTPLTPYDPDTGKLINAEQMTRWQALEQRAKGKEKSAHQAYEQMQPIFKRNEEAARFLVH